MTEKVTEKVTCQVPEKPSKTEEGDSHAEVVTFSGVQVSLSAADVAELAAEERRWRADGRPLVGQVDRQRGVVAGRSPGATRRLPETWTVVHVLDRLEEAFEILGRMPMVTRPNGHQSMWPVYAYEHGDLVAQIETGELERLARTRNNYRVRGATSAEVARMEQALSWASDYLNGLPEVARAVQLGALWAAFKVDVKEACKKRGINRKAFLRQKIHGLTIITTQLVQGRVPIS